MRKLNQNGALHIVAVVVVIVLGVVGFGGWKVYESNKTKKASPERSSTTSTTDSKQSDTSVWKDYTIKELGYKFSAPSDWKVDVSAQPHDFDGVKYQIINNGIITAPSGNTIVVGYNPVGGGGGDCTPKATDTVFSATNECPTVLYISSEKLAKLSGAEKNGLTNERYLVHTKYMSAQSSRVEYSICLDMSRSSVITVGIPQMGFFVNCQFFKVGFDMHYRVTSEADLSSDEAKIVEKIMKSVDTI